MNGKGKSKIEDDEEEEEEEDELEDFNDDDEDSDNYIDISELLPSGPKQFLFLLFLLFFLFLSINLIMNVEAMNLMISKILNSVMKEKMKKLM